MSDGKISRRPAAPLAPPGTTPRTVEEARLDVQRSRARIEATLDQLEGRVVDAKERIQRKVDVVKQAREFVTRKPVLAVAAGLAVGLILGSFGGGSDEEEADEYGFDKRERKALDEWRGRRRKLLMSEAEDAADDLFEEPPSRLSRFFRAVGHEAAGVMVGVMAAELAERFYGGRSEDSEDGAETDYDDDDGI